MNSVSKALVGNLMIALMGFAGCASVSSTNSPERRESNTSNQLTASTPREVAQPIDSADAALLKRFAESYEPKSGRTVIPEPPILDTRLAEVIAKAAKSTSRDHEKYVVLVFLKLSRFQIEHFKQRYELGRENPLTREFYRLVSEKDYQRAELMAAYLADTHVENNPELRRYALIDAEMRRIKRMEERIESDLNKVKTRKRP